MFDSGIKSSDNQLLLFLSKVWSVPSSNVSHVTREEPLQPRRVPSVFVTNTDNKAQQMEISQVEGSVREEVKKARKIMLTLFPNYA